MEKTFEDYRAALMDVGPAVQERILREADNDKRLDAWALEELARMVYREP